MGSHPINLGVRFLLELAALIAIGNWGWRLGEGWMRWVFALGIPLLIGIVWGTFAVPDDPSRSGAAPVPTPGMIRLIIELAILGFGAWALLDTGLDKWGWLMAGVIIVHYLISYDRILWLWSQ